MALTNIYNISRYLEKLLNVSAYNDGILNGIQIEGNRPVATLASAVTASLYAIEQASALHADLLLTHHGLFLKNGPLSLQGILKERTAVTLSSGLHLLTYHLPLDANEEYGNAWPVARALGWENLAGFGDYYGKKIGVCGTLKQPLSMKVLYASLQQHWNAEGICLGGDRQIQTVAFVSGSGHRFVQEALLSNIDCLITGTVDDSTWHVVQESKIVVMAFGHHATERLGVQLLGRHLSETFGLKYHFIDENNPF